MKSFAGILTLASLLADSTFADGAGPPSGNETKPWCGPEVSELSDHVCFFEATAATTTRRTLVIYLHGSLATTPGFQYVQQRSMAIQAKRMGFTLLMPTAPLMDHGYWWPASAASRKTSEGDVVAGIRSSRALLEERLGHGFDETVVVGFSSGAYYASSLAERGALDVDGYIVLAGGSPFSHRQDTPPRVPVFVGVSASDGQTARHSRALGASLSALGWPHRLEERNVGHIVDIAFLAHGLHWIHDLTTTKTSNNL